MADRGSRRPPSERPDERPDDDADAGAEDGGLTSWLRRTIGPRPREVWVMEPDGRMRRGMTNDE